MQYIQTTTDSGAISFRVDFSTPAPKPTVDVVRDFEKRETRTLEQGELGSLIRLWAGV